MAIKSLVAFLLVLIVSASAFAPFAPSRVTAFGIQQKHTKTITTTSTSSSTSSTSLSFWRRRRVRSEESTAVVEEGATVAEKDFPENVVNATTSAIDEECIVEEELSETQKLLKQVKDAGIAGVISYAAWELGFWTVSVPIVIFGYREVAGHWPDLSNKEDVAKLGAEAFAFVNFARFAVPLRIGLALSTTPWIQENIVDRFLKKEEEICEPAAED